MLESDEKHQRVSLLPVSASGFQPVTFTVTSKAPAEDQGQSTRTLSGKLRHVTKHQKITSYHLDQLLKLQLGKNPPHSDQTRL